MRAFSSGLLGAFGHDPRIGIPDFEGDVEFDPEAVASARMRMQIVASSLNVLDDISENDRTEIHRRMYNDILEVGRFPDIVFECSQVTANGGGMGRYWVALNGDLNLHGISRNQLVSARVMVNGTSIRASGEFALKQSDFEIRPPVVAGGAISIKNELKFSFDVVARKDEAVH